MPSAYVFNKSMTCVFTYFGLQDLRQQKKKRDPIAGGPFCVRLIYIFRVKFTFDKGNGFLENQKGNPYNRV
ncbi:hypothetical protein FUAX_19430 [Fulvitalea axinellae]|uniref:Transposase n=1 Tax=Fulvitalea axinellae TaxID=1182444 RepID=A0AAU9CKM5_9BACT|nr:hypothetical protein FUAX_19430 [Fulvitalea axinellae]